MIIRQILEFQSLTRRAQFDLLSMFTEARDFVSYNPEIPLLDGPTTRLLWIDVTWIQGAPREAKDPPALIVICLVLYQPEKVRVSLTERGRATLYHLREVTGAA